MNLNRIMQQEITGFLCWHEMGLMLYERSKTKSKLYSSIVVKYF